MANTDDESCDILVVSGCLDYDYTEYNELATTDDESCDILVVSGCLDSDYTE